MSKILYLLVVGCLTLTSCSNVYNWTIKTSVTGTVADIDYSPDQQYVALAKLNNEIVLYDGVTAYPQGWINYDTAYTFSSFSFSQDSSQLAAGFKAGDGTTLIKIYKSKTAQELQSFTVDDSSDGNEVVSVNSLCYAADNSHIMYSTSQGDICSLRIADGNRTCVKFDTISATTVACSPSRSLEFSAGGSNTQGQESKLKTYSIHGVTNAIQVDHEYVLQNPNEAVNSIVYSTSGAFLYRAGSVGLYKTNVNNYEEVTIQTVEGLKDFMKIRVSLKEDIIVVSTKDLTLYTIKFVPDANARIEQVQSINIVGFGLAPKGQNQMFMQTTSMATVTSQCKINQLLNDADVCVNCDATCRMCMETITTCRLCYEAFYLTGGSCLKCIDRCKGCTNGASCSICYDPFILKANRQCGCPDSKFIDGLKCSDCVKDCKTCENGSTCQACNRGFFVKAGVCSVCPEGCLECSAEDKCSTCDEGYELDGQVCSVKGFPTWAIVLLILLGLSIVIVISGVVFVRVRRQKRSPLLTDSDEGVAAQD